jgi:uncharacterized protein (TIGR03032 family)
MQQNSQSLAPFSCNYTPQVAELLLRLNCSLAVTTYQAGKFIFISPKDENYLIQLPRTFEKPMGFSFNEDYSKLAIASKDCVQVFSSSKELAYYYPKSPQTYDNLFVPRLTYHTSALDVHDLQFGENEKLYAVNTLFSCIVELDSSYNFTPYWKPKQITELVSEDRCHLNGMAMLNGKPKYASAFNNGNSAGSWRENITKSGVIYEIESNEIIAENLGMPHSPKIFNNELYVLLSATGELVKINPTTGEKEVIVKLEGFVRGMSLYKDYLFIGLSKLRENSSTFSKLKFEHKANESGIYIVHLPSKSIAGKITYLSSVDEIYDIHILADSIRPNIMNTLTPDYKKSLMIPGATYWAKMDEAVK